MEKVDSIYNLPNRPAVYAMFGGRKNRSIAYIGTAQKLKARMRAHFYRRQSSVATGESAAGLYLDRVTEVRWWEHEAFSDEVYLEAAEVIASNLLNPILRSSKNPKKLSAEKAEDLDYKQKMEKLFNGDPTGILYLPTTEYLHEKIRKLENRVLKIERDFKKVCDK